MFDKTFEARMLRKFVQIQYIHLCTTNYYACIKSESTSTWLASDGAAII